MFCVGVRVKDGKVIVWDAHVDTKHAKDAAFQLKTNWLMAVGYGTGGQLVATGGLDNLCTVFRLDQTSSEDAYRELSGHDGYVSCCRFRQGDAQVVTSSSDKSCALWDVERSKQVTSYSAGGHTEDVLQLALGARDTFVSVGCDHTARLWDIRDPQCQAVYTGHSSVRAVGQNQLFLFPFEISKTWISGT